VTKVVWDLRADVGSLRALNVRVRGVVDLQLDDVAARAAAFARGAPAAPQAAAEARDALSRVLGLGHVLRHSPHARLRPQERERVHKVKEDAQLLFVPEKGGNLHVWRERPLKAELVEYCSDARFFFGLRESYAAARLQLLGPSAAHRVAAAIAAAVERRMCAAARGAAAAAADKAAMVRADVRLVADVLDIAAACAPAAGAPAAGAARAAGAAGAAGAARAAGALVPV
jgi:hypothetical protein